jgi:protein SCO1/2
MKKSKRLYLFLALLLPILFSVFLKYFGKSEFNIPVYYETEVDSLGHECGYQYKIPYAVPDSLLVKLVGGAGHVIMITIDSTAGTKKNFERINEDVGNTSYQFVVLKNDSLTDKWKSCFFFLKKPWTTLLIDERNRVRGYYAPGTREETDRLMVELKILLKQY